MNGFGRDRVKWRSSQSVYGCKFGLNKMRISFYLDRLNSSPLFSFKRHLLRGKTWDVAGNAMYRLVFNELGRVHGSALHRRPRSTCEFCRWLSIADNIWNEGKFLPLFTITGGVEIAAPPHVDISRTGGTCSDLPSEDSLQEYLKFPYECFLSVRLFEGYCCKLCPSNNPRRKNHTDNFSALDAYVLFSYLLTSPVVLSLFTKLWIVCLLRTLSSRNFRRHFPADPYFTWVPYRNTRCSSIANHVVPHCWLLTGNRWLMTVITTAYCWQIINKRPCMNITSHRVT
jgi:hypothetical protein